jgi:hypothetical protein
MSCTATCAKIVKVGVEKKSIWQVASRTRSASFCSSWRPSLLSPAEALHAHPLTPALHGERHSLEEARVTVLRVDITSRSREF